MHDPDVVAFDIPRPWPERSALGNAKPGGRRWKIRHHHDCITCSDEERAEHVGRDFFPWWRPGSYTKFWTLAGRGWYWPPLVTVWHREPHGRDSGEVCKHWRTVGGERKPTGRWRWHVHHWRIQIRPVQAVHRFLFERCIECGRRYPYGYAPVSHQWDEPRGPWWRVTRRAYHHECSGLVEVRRDRDALEGLVRRLVTEIRFRADETEREMVERLTDRENTTWEWHEQYRLQRVLGYSRDDDYRLVKEDSR